VEMNTEKHVNRKRVKSLMILAGHSRADLALILGCSLGTLNNKLSGHREFTLTDLHRLSSQYGQPIDYFFMQS